jgi:DNA (cytosine-5)-methyltransferase 1
MSGGFPCQPFSCAGKQKGKADDRYLWPEYLRIIRELQPRWVVGENVPGIIKIALDDILDSIEAEGYTTQTYSYPVSLLGACHKRERIFIVAHNNKIGCDYGESQRKGVFRNQPTCDEDRERDCNVTNVNNAGSGTQGPEPDTNGQEINKGCKGLALIGVNGHDCNAPNMHTEGLQGYGQYGERSSELPIGEGTWEESWIEVAARLCRVDDGIPSRVDRLKCLGNAVVPAQVYPILKAIADYENGIII